MTQQASALSREGRFFRQGKERRRLLGVTYGPFNRPLEGTERCRRDLDDIRTCGFNAIRVYETPAPSFLEACRERDLLVWVSLNWVGHHDFRKDADKIAVSLAETVGRLGGSPALGGYFVGNEIPATMVRWLGSEWVRDFLERLIDRLREVDPHRLYTYANYPSTEYLRPRNGDVAAFNVFLEDRDSLEGYLHRLSHHADDLPLVISEFGLDSLRHGERAQADHLEWMTEALFTTAGVAGAFLFSYTDEWFNGGRSVKDWAFGLVSSSREPKPSRERMQAVLAALPKVTSSMARFLGHEGAWPRVSVVVCSHNGHRTLPACLDALQRCLYPQLEVVVVDDGSVSGMDAIVSNDRGFHYVRQEHEGLSAARNRGAREATGEIIVFTDDDCEADPEWLHWMVLEMLRGGHDACGGPNIDRVAQGWMARCIQLAPGHPSHVMLDDVRAEHLPGCNLAVTREAFDAVGGFSEGYRVAGDDVDFCWRLRMAGRTLGFAANAVVWHQRRRTWSAFVRQQCGYGRAEALLTREHPDKMGPWGGAQWAGQVYGVAAERLSWRRPLVYHGPRGMAPYQWIYSRSEGWGEMGLSLITSVEWALGMLVMVALGVGLPWAWGVAVCMALLSFAAGFVAVSGTCVSGLPSRWKAKLLLAWIHWSANGARQWVRWWHGTSWGGRSLREEFAVMSLHGLGRERLLEAVRDHLSAQGGRPRVSSLRQEAWHAVDEVLPQTRSAYWTLVTTTEVHDGDGRLTRFRVQAHLKRAVLLALGLGLTAGLGLCVGGHGAWGLGALLIWSALVTGLVVVTRRRMQEWIAALQEVATRAGVSLVSESFV